MPESTIPSISMKNIRSPETNFILRFEKRDRHTDDGADDGNNPVISRYAYFSQVDGAVGSASYNLVNFGPSAKKDYDSYWAVQGDTFTIEGVKITFVSTGDYETVKIEKAQN